MARPNLTKKWTLSTISIDQVSCGSCDRKGDLCSHRPCLQGRTGSTIVICFVNANIQLLAVRLEVWIRRKSAWKIHTVMKFIVYLCIVRKLINCNGGNWKLKTEEWKMIIVFRCAFLHWKDVWLNLLKNLYDLIFFCNLCVSTKCKPHSRQAK